MIYVQFCRRSSGSGLFEAAWFSHGKLRESLHFFHLDRVLDPVCQSARARRAALHSIQYLRWMGFWICADTIPFQTRRSRPPIESFAFSSPDRPFPLVGYPPRRWLHGLCFSFDLIIWCLARAPICLPYSRVCTYIQTFDAVGVLELTWAARHNVEIETQGVTRVRVSTTTIADQGE